ncbi:MAG: phage integrase SAM-like domain-containing protein [Planctomycetaceae bacterium]|nr:phage integrase SAM-like domain-containing protein [Planctomycetaceae bacterium]
MLSDRGLVEPRQSTGTLTTFIDSYIEGRTDVTDRRLEKLKQAKHRLVEYFGDVELGSITAGGADEYGRWLLKQVAPTTANKECQIAAQFFRHAFRKELISRSPFDGVAVGTSTNNDRRVFVSRDVVKEVLDSCPDWQWRTVVALARYGGLRCSSEVALLKWTDICWDKDRFVVTSPKTKRYGKATRLVPIFPELRPYLEEAFDLASDGAVWVVPMLNGEASKNLGTTFKRIIKGAGVEVWVKPFQNLRASRQTELERQHPTYKVCAWMGNTPTVAHKHYLTVTEDDFKSAAQSATGDSRGMQPHENGCDVAQNKTRAVHHVRENTSFAEVVGILENARVAEEGLEPPTRGL